MNTLSPSTEPAGAQAPATACRKCGANHFTVIESYTHKAEIVSEGNDTFLHCFGWQGGVDTITCEECGEAYASTDFQEIIIS
jgi:hypothetical protein